TGTTRPSSIKSTKRRSSYRRRRGGRRVRHHSIVARLGAGDTVTIAPSRADTQLTEINFVDGDHRPGYGLGEALDQLRELGLRPSETAVDLALLAATVTAADTRISRARDAWTREIAVHLPVRDPSFWDAQAALLVQTLNFLTGDRWSVY